MPTYDLGALLVDKYILQRLLQGYKIPPVTHISVDGLYARSSKQQKGNEARDDLFLTVIVDHRTHKVIWVSQSRRKDALDMFFTMIGSEACNRIQVFTVNQHKGYAGREKYQDEEANDDLMHGKYRYIYLTKAKNRSETDRQHIQTVMARNQKIAQMECIKEHFH